jgi:LmbE family N-acetylglucosaminyl deacetylase
LGYVLDRKRVIVFAPHPDDETLGCGGTIAKKIAEGYDVLVVVMTDGMYAFLKVLGIDSDPTPEELKETRKEELKRATRILGVPEENLIFLDFVDGTLQDNMEEAEKKIVEILSGKYPVEVYFPYKGDDHPDHRAACQIVKNSVTKLGIPTEMYQYLITPKYARFSPFINVLLNYLRRNIIYVDISKFLLKKKAAVKEFKTEITRFLDKQQGPIVPNIERFLKTKEVFYSDK